MKNWGRGYVGGECEAVEVLREIGMDYKTNESKTRNSGCLIPTVYFRNSYKGGKIWRIIAYSFLIAIAVSFLDIKNIGSYILSEIGAKETLTLGILLVGLVLTMGKTAHIYQIRKIIAINELHIGLSAVAFGIVEYLCAIWFCDIVVCYKVAGSLAIESAVLIVMFQRACQYKEVDEKNSDYKKNIVDLKDLYENNLDCHNNHILLEEKDVDYDLLKRGSVISHLYNVICICQPREHFVISLEGKWGSGKTTIIKNVKRKLEQTQKDIIVIDDFSPWLYGSEESLVENLFLSILRKNDLKINTAELRKCINIVSQAVVDTYMKDKGFEIKIGQKGSVAESKRRINEYLELCGKKIVIILDDLDRLDADKVIFLFKLVGTVINFKRVIYVLAFDPEKVKTIFDKQLNVDYSYLKKIIQLQIPVPEMDQEVLSDVLKRCTRNLLQRYTDQNEKEYTSYINCLTESVDDIRDYKRSVNSLMLRILTMQTNLSKKDLLGIMLIRMNNYALYNEIYNNRKYFISESTIYDRDILEFHMEREKAKEAIGKYFDTLFATNENGKYQNLLADLFPNVVKYSKSYEKNNEWYDEHANIEISRGIASAKYFDLYFSETENEFSVLGGLIDQFIEQIKGNPQSAYSQLDGLVKQVGRGLHREMLESIQLRLPELNEETCFHLLKASILQIWCVDDSFLFLMISGRQRLLYVIWELLQKVEDTHYHSIIELFWEKYEYFGVICSIERLFERERGASLMESRKDAWIKLRHDVVQHIVEEDINLYNDEYYHHHNAISLSNHMSAEEYREYNMRHLNRKTVFRMLYDVLGHALSGRHSYYYKRDTMERFFAMDKLNEFMRTVQAKTEDEEFLLSQYKKYLKNPTEEGNETYTETELYLNV